MVVQAPPCALRLQFSYSINNGSFGSQILGEFFTITSTSGKGNIDPRQIFFIYLDVDRQDTLQGRIFPSQDYPKYLASKCTIEHCVQSTRSFYSLSDPTAASPYREETLKIWTAEASSIRSPGYQVIVPAEPEYGAYGQNFSIGGYTMESILMFIGDTFEGYYSKIGSLDNSFQKPGKQTFVPDEVILAPYGPATSQTAPTPPTAAPAPSTSSPKQCPRHSATGRTPSTAPKKQLTRRSYTYAYRGCGSHYQRVLGCWR